MKRPKHFFEPWFAQRSRAWESSFRLPPPVDDPEQAERWHSARDRAEKQAPWIVWGSDMLTPQVCTTPSGDVAVMDDACIIARVYPTVTDRSDAPGHDAISQRVVECVNSCSGIIDPCATIEEVRSLLVDLSSGRVTLDDARVLRVMVKLAGASTTGKEDF